MNCVKWEEIRWYSVLYHKHGGYLKQLLNIPKKEIFPEDLKIKLPPFSPEVDAVVLD